MTEGKLKGQKTVAITNVVKYYTFAYVIKIYNHTCLRRSSCKKRALKLELH